MTEQFNTPDSILARLERLQASGKTALRPSPLSSEMILARLSGKDINTSDITASEKSGHEFHGNQWTDNAPLAHTPSNFGSDEADKFLTELNLYEKDGWRYMQTPKGKCSVNITDLHYNGNNVELHWLIATKRGAGRAAIERICHLADKHKVNIELFAVPLKPDLQNKGSIQTKEMLESFYKEFGFQQIGKRDKDGFIKMKRLSNADARIVTASDVRREILRRKIEVIRAAAKDVSKEHRDANGKWASNPAGEPKGKIKHAVLIIDGKRYKGASHMSALMDWGMKNHKEGLPKVPERHQGFETESGHYLDREEAAEYGLKNNLVKEDADEAENTGKLRSEMLHLKATDGKLYAVETITAEARTAEQDLAPELREHNRIRDEAEAPYRHAMARLIAAAELAKLKEKKAASKKKKEQEEAALIALWLLLMQDASQEAYATAGNALGGLLTVQPPSIPLTDAETPQIEPQNEIPPITTEEASGYFDRRKPLIQDIPNRVMERLDKAIDAGRSLGEDDRLLRLRLKREAQAIQSGYGEMVARNEAQATYTGAQIATLRKAGFATKIWVTMDDDRVRESHIDCGQQGEVPLDKPFMNGLMYPCEPDAPPEETCNCRCWLIGGRRIGEAVQATENQQPDGKVMSKGSLSVGRGEKLPISKGAGLTAKGRAKYNRAHGSNLKAPAPHPKTEKDAARRRSFCARMKGVVKHAKGDAPRAKASLKRWNCH